MMKRGLYIFLIVCFAANVSQLQAQCSSLFTTPEFPIATHPSDGHTQSWGANLFMQAQMGAPANFTGIQVYVDNSFGPTTYANQQVWLRHSAITSYPNAAYPTTAGFTQCFAGTYSFPMSGLYTIAFNVASFAYNGTSNVEILFENRSNVYRANEPWFRRTTSYGASTYRSKWNGNFGFGGFPGSGSDGSAVRLTYNLSLTALGGGGCGVVLPVAFPDFAAVPDGKSVHCAWQVDVARTSEVVLERSGVEGVFSPVASFPGSITGAVDWVDAQPLVGVNLYRLRSQDADGVAQLSAMAMVDMENLLQPKLYANASTSGIDVLIDSPDHREAKLSLSDIQGRRMVAMPLHLEPGRNHVEVPVSKVDRLWLLQLESGEAHLTAKIIH